MSSRGKLPGDKTDTITEEGGEERGLGRQASHRSGSTGPEWGLCLGPTDSEGPVGHQTDEDQRAETYRGLKLSRKL